MSSLEPDIIVAVASAPGTGRRGIVRVSGPGVPERLHPMVRLAPLPGDDRWTAAEAGGEPPRGLARATLSAWPAEGGPGGDLPCLGLVFRGPASYTGEDGLELFPPGSPLLLESIVTRLVAGGRAAGLDIGRAGPGDFSLRAWRNGRLDLVEAEAVAALIAAGDEAELRAARALSGGAFAARVAALADETALTLARLEAGIDFADEEDVVILAADELARRLDEHRRELSDLRAAGGRRESASALPRVVLTGPPNAGKSTLFNALLGREAAITSDEVGTTRDVLEATCPLGDGGRMVRLADAAGIDPSDRGGAGARAAAQEQATSALLASDLRIACVPVDQPVADHLAAVGGGAGERVGERVGGGSADATILVRTMADRLGDRRDRRRAVDHAIGEVWISARDGVGIDALVSLIDRRLDARLTAGNADTGVLARHRAALQAASERLEDAMDRIAGDRRAGARSSVREPELLAAELRDALDRLGEISGMRSADDVLGLVFGSFCIGK